MSQSWENPTSNKRGFWGIEKNYKKGAIEDFGGHGETERDFYV